MTRLASAFLASALLAPAVSLSAVNAFAADYRGMAMLNNRPVPITLHIEDNPKREQSAGSVRFGEPWACVLTLGLTGASSTYAVQGSGGGRCDQFLGGQATVSGSGDVVLRISGSRGTPTMDAQLRP